MIAGLPFPVPAELEAAVRTAYAEPARAYHHFGHVEDVLRTYAAIPPEVRKAWAPERESNGTGARAVPLAILFHDAVYEPGRSDNEQRSAELARALVIEYLPTDAALLPRIEALIVLTAAHGRLTPSDVDPEAALFLDADMSILGASPEAFDAYERAIRAEYSFLPAETFAAGRRAFLQKVLSKDAIFLSEFFRTRLDGAARRNIGRAIGSL